MQEVKFLRPRRACLHQLPAPRMQKKRKETKQLASPPIKTCRVVNSVVRLVSQVSVISATEAALPRSSLLPNPPGKFCRAQSIANRKMDKQPKPVP